MREIVSGDSHHIVQENPGLLAEADVVFLEGNTWRPIPGFARQSVLGGEN